MVLLRSNSSIQMDKHGMPPAPPHTLAPLGTQAQLPPAHPSTASLQSLGSMTSNRSSDRSSDRSSNQSRLPIHRIGRSRSPIVAVNNDHAKEKENEEERANMAAGQKRKRPQSINRQVSVDTSRARSNGPVVKMCLETLGWRDVSIFN